MAHELHAEDRHLPAGVRSDGPRSCRVAAAVIRADLTGQSLDEQECSMSSTRKPLTGRDQVQLSPIPGGGGPLALLAIADFVVILDATIVNVALPSIGRGLHASTSDPSG